MKKRKILNKFFPYLLVSSMVLGNLTPVYADSETQVQGTIQASTIDVSASATANYSITGKTITSDAVGIVNNSNFPINLGVARVEKTLGSLEDVLPETVGDENAWFSLGKNDSNSKIALGLKHTSGDYLEEGRTENLYFKEVMDSEASINLGAVGSKGSINYEIDGFHGLAFTSDITEQYKITWDLGIYKGESTSKFLVDKEDETPLNYETNNNLTASINNVVDSLDNLFGVHTVMAAPIEEKIDDSKIAGTATITGLKESSSETDIYIADYYKTSDGKYYKIVGIKEKAFVGENVASVTVNNQNIDIGAFAFAGTPITANPDDNGLVIIDGILVDGTHASGDVVIPETVHTIASNAFYDYTISNDGDSSSISFSSNVSLTGITIPDSVTKIGNSAFAFCTYLTKASIPDTVTLDAYTFNSCYRLKQIKYKGDFTKYPWGATNATLVNEFTTDENLTPEPSEKLTGGLYIDNVLIKTWDEVLSSTELSVINEGTLTSDNGAGKADSTRTNLNALSGKLVIPDTITAIDAFTFTGCNNLTSVVIPKSVISIGNLAFQQCGGFTSIIVDSENPVYDSRNNCNAIIETATNTLIKGSNSTVIPNDIVTIANSAFYKCSSLTDITIPNSVTTIGNSAFKNCKGFKGDLVIPNSVTSIGTYAFAEVYMKSVTIPNSITSISDYAFNNCLFLKTVNIPQGVTSIGKYAFNGTNLEGEIVLPEGLLTIGRNAFYSSPNLTSVTIPDSVTSIDIYAFYQVQHIYYNGTATGSPWSAKAVN